MESITYFKQVRCCFCGDKFIGVFSKQKSNKKVKEQEEKAMCGGFIDGKLVCKRGIEAEGYSIA